MTKDEWRQTGRGFTRWDCQGFYVTVPEIGYRPVPLACPVCDLLMRTADDLNCYHDSECCESCHLRWVEPRRLEWKAGWRPEPDELKDYVDVRMSRPRRILI